MTTKHAPEILLFIRLSDPFRLVMILPDAVLAFCPTNHCKLGGQQHLERLYCTSNDPIRLTLFSSPRRETIATCHSYDPLWVNPEAGMY